MLKYIDIISVICYLLSSIFIVHHELKNLNMLECQNEYNKRLKFIYICQN